MTDQKTLQCNGKQAFLSWQAANTVVKFMRRKKRSRRGTLTNTIAAYLCPWCGFWHIGAERPKRIRQPKRPKSE